MVASLARRFGDLDVAEEAAGEALLVALERWPVDGVPPNPGGWLTTTAARRALDRIRREQQRDAKHRAALMIHDDTPPEPTGAVDDDRLRLIFTCCHPALAPEARVALTLRLLGGLTVAEIAAAFLVPETTMAQRITRAKAKIKGARIPYRVPSADDLAERLAAVLTVVYLVFNEGYLASAGDAPVRAELTDEAIRLGRVLRALLPEEPEVAGLLALMLLVDARRREPGGGRRAGAAAGAGPGRVGPHADHRGPRAGPRVPGPGPPHGSRARALPAAGGGQRRPHRRAVVGRHRLAPDRGALRPAPRRGPRAGGRAQPGRGGRGARRAGRRAGGGGPAGADRLPRLARHPRRPPAPAGPVGARRARPTTRRSRRRTTRRSARSSAGAGGSCPGDPRRSVSGGSWWSRSGPPHRDRSPTAG